MIADPVDEKKTSGRMVSYWTESVQPLMYAPLRQHLRTDVVIVGGGIAGISIAYNLVMRGKRVVVLEDGYIGSGETGRTTAHLVTSLDDRYYRLQKLHGKEGAMLAAESHKKAIDFIENTVRDEKIECEFERLKGYLFLHPSDRKEALNEELDAALAAGVNVYMQDTVPGMMKESGPCLVFPDQAQFHVLKYLRGLCQVITARNGKIFTETHALKIESSKVTTSDGFVVMADHIVVATNTPVNNRFAIHAKQAALRSYVIGAKIKKGILNKALWWDTGDHQANPAVPPYHYVRLNALDSDYDLLICGGEDHPTGTDRDEEQPYLVLEKWTRERFPIENVIYRWSGQVMETIDSLAYIGRNPLDKDNVYIVTGDSGNGLTHATIAGTLIPDLIVGAKNKYQDLYDPSRFRLVNVKGYLKDSVHVLREYFSDLNGSFNTSELSDIKRNGAKIVEIKGEKYGAHRDSNGALHLVSAVCTHMQCTVKWNKSESTWDCPCHGSRFTHEGEVLNGPANTPLLHYLHKEKTEFTET